jgi:hypothetical protein
MGDADVAGAPSVETAPLLGTGARGGGTGGRPKSKLNVTVTADEVSTPALNDAEASAPADDDDGNAEKLVQAAKLRRWLIYMMGATILVLVAIIITGVVLRRSRPTNYTSGCPTVFDDKVDYFPNKVLKREAGADFSVQYGLNYKVRPPTR